jgi:hypothetical protein
MNDTKSACITRCLTTEVAAIQTKTAGAVYKSRGNNQSGFGMRNRVCLTNLVSTNNLYKETGFLLLS